MKNRQSIPKQYLQGWVEFYKLKFKVTPDVLIPRPETELLVDEVLTFIGSGPKGLTLTILDIGTGAGNIAISLAKNLPKSRIFATDISEEILEVARENAKLNKVQDKIFFVKSDLLNTFLLLQKNEIKLNLIIVTNLPYIPRGRMPYLDPSVRDFEPWTALVGGADGFELYKKLFEEIKSKNLNPKLIVCEIDHTHAITAVQEAKKYFPNAKIEVKLDLAKKPRILVIIH